MSTYTQIIYHLVFSTYRRKATLPMEHRRDFLAYVVGAVDGMNCKVYRVNSRPEHVHLLFQLHPTVKLSDFVKSLKISTGNWLRDHPDNQGFDHWQEGYGAFTKSWADRQKMIAYIRDQDAHHQTISFADEFRELLLEEGIEWDERFLE